MRAFKEIFMRNMTLLLLSSMLLLYVIFDFGINFMFVTILIEFICICIKCKLSFFTVKHLCVNYIVLALYYQFNFNMSYGILEYTSMPILYKNMLVGIALYNLIWLFIFYKTNIIEYEENKIRYSNYSLNGYFVLLLCAISISSVIIAFPRLPFVKVSSISERFAALLPGNAWNHIAVISMIMVFPAFKKSITVKGTYIFNIFWFISHYERVDVIGLVFGLLIVYYVKTNAKINIMKMMKFGIPIIIIAVALTIIGDARNNKKYEISFPYIMNKLLVQSTSADEAFIYNLAVRYREEKGNLYIKPYVAYLYNSIPLLDYDEDITSILKSNYVGHPGGEYLLSLPYMSLGYVGIIFFAVLEYCILYAIINKKGILSYVWYLFILCTSFRIVWYGISYIEMGVIYIIPFMLLLSRFFKKGIKYEYKEGEKYERKNSNSYSL